MYLSSRLVFTDRIIGNPQFGTNIPFGFSVFMVRYYMLIPYLVFIVFHLIFFTAHVVRLVIVYFVIIYFLNAIESERHLLIIVKPNIPYKVRRRHYYYSKCLAFCPNCSPCSSIPCWIILHPGNYIS